MGRRVGRQTGELEAGGHGAGLEAGRQAAGRCAGRKQVGESGRVGGEGGRGCGLVGA